MSTWKKLCERRDRNEAKLDMYIWKQEFDEIRAVVEASTIFVTELNSVGLLGPKDLSIALKALGVIE